MKKLRIVISIAVLTLFCFYGAGCMHQNSINEKNYPVMSEVTESEISLEGNAQLQYSLFPGYESLDQMVTLPDIILVHAVVTNISEYTPSENYDTVTMKVINASVSIDPEIVYHNLRECFRLEEGQEIILVVTPVQGSKEYTGVQTYISQGSGKTCLFTKDDEGKMIGTFMDELLADANQDGEVSMETVYDLLISRREANMTE